MKIAKIHKTALHMTWLAEHGLIKPCVSTPASVLLSMCVAWLAIFRLAPVEMYAAASGNPCALLGSCLAVLSEGLVLLFNLAFIFI